MASSLSIKVDGQLVESNMPGVGRSVKVKVTNDGTRDLFVVEVEVVGEGADHIELSGDQKSWTKTLELRALKKAESETFWARAVYTPEDADDNLEYEIVASAMILT
jgi:hypothetical protein